MPTRAQKEHALTVLDLLVEQHPDARCELDFAPQQPWQLLVAVVLSAQCTDVAVNKATPALFEAFPDVFAFAKAEPEELHPYVKMLNLFRNKAKFLVGAARLVVTRHQGVVPSERAKLEALPGVGTKSAAVIIANAFGEPALAVDTHVGRVSRRLALTRHTDPDKVEHALTALLPRERLLEAHHTIIIHGRRVCNARKPKCLECNLVRECPRVGVSKSIRDEVEAALRDADARASES